MGYTTEFEGSVTIEPPLNEKEIEYLNKFADVRHMDRKKGPYYVGSTEDFGQGQDDDIIDYNSPDSSQPGLWCQWVVGNNPDSIFWDGNEKFYAAAEWMQYLIDHFIGKNPLAKLNSKDFDFLQGHSVNGEFLATGEEEGDHWKIIVKDGIVTTKQGHVVYD